MRTYVYFIQCCDVIGLWKIGVSKSPEARLKALATGNGQKLVLKGTIECPSPKAAFDLESQLHKVFEYSRAKGEWFTNSQPLREVVRRINNGLRWNDTERAAFKVTKSKRHKHAWYLKKYYKSQDEERILAEMLRKQKHLLESKE